MKITCTSVLDYLKKKFLDTNTCDDTCKNRMVTNVAIESPTPPRICSPIGLKHLTKSLTRIESQSRGPCSCSELNINGRALHYVIRVDDRDASLKFYTDVMGMKVLRNEEVKIKECKSDQPFQSKTIVGYGAEDNYFCLQLIYDCKKRNHLKGNECIGLTVITSQALEQAKRLDWPVHSSNMLEAPDGLKIFIIDSPAPVKSDPIIKISLPCTNVIASLTFWHSMLGLILFQNCKLAKRAHISFRYDEVQIELRQMDVVVNRADSIDRMVFSCPLEQLQVIQGRVSREFEGRVVIPLTKQQHDGLEFIVLADPDGHEVCFVDDLRFRQISRLKPEVRKQVGERTQTKVDPEMLKSCLKKDATSKGRSCCRRSTISKTSRSGIPVPIPGYCSSKSNSGNQNYQPTPSPKTSEMSLNDYDEKKKKKRNKDKERKEKRVKKEITGATSKQDHRSNTSLWLSATNPSKTSFKTRGSNVSLQPNNPSRSNASFKSNISSSDKLGKSKKAKEEKQMKKQEKELLKQEKLIDKMIENRRAERKSKSRSKAGQVHLMYSDQIAEKRSSGECADGLSNMSSKEERKNEKNNKKKKAKRVDSDEDVTAEDIIMDCLLGEEEVCTCCPSDITSCPHFQFEDLCCDQPTLGCEDSPSESYFRNCLTKSSQTTYSSTTPKVNIAPSSSLVSHSPAPVPATSCTLECGKNPPKPSPSNPVKPNEKKFEQHITVILKSDKYGKTSVSGTEVSDGQVNELDVDTGDSSSQLGTSTTCTPSCSGMLHPPDRPKPAISTKGPSVWSPHSSTSGQMPSFTTQCIPLPSMQYVPPPPMQYGPPLQQPFSTTQIPCTACIRPPQQPVQEYRPYSDYHLDRGVHKTSPGASKQDIIRRIKAIDRKKREQRKIEGRKNYQDRKEREGLMRRAKELDKLEKKAKKDGKLRRMRLRDPRRHHSQSQISRIPYDYPTSYESEPTTPQISPTTTPYPSCPPSQYPSQNQFQTYYPALPNTSNVPNIVTQCPPQCRYPEVSPCPQINNQRYPYESDESEDDLHKQYYHHPARNHPHSASFSPLHTLSVPPYNPRKKKGFAERSPTKVVYKIEANGCGKRKTLLQKPHPPPKRTRGEYLEEESGAQSGKDAPMSIEQLPNEVAPSYTPGSTYGTTFTNEPTQPVMPSTAGNVLARGKCGQVKLIDIYGNGKKKKKEEIALYKKMERLREIERLQDDVKRKELMKQEKKLEKEKMEIEKEKDRFGKEKLKEAEREKQRLEEEKLKMERERERVEREKERENEREKERLQKEKEMVEREIEIEKERARRENERIAIELEREKIRQMQADRERCRQFIPDRLPQLEVCDQNDYRNRKQSEIPISKDITKLLQKAAKKLEISSTDDSMCSNLSYCNPNVNEREVKEVSKLLREIAKSQKKHDQSIKGTVTTNSKRVGSGCTSTKGAKCVHCTNQAYHMISATKLSKFETKLTKLFQSLPSSSSSFQAFENAQVATISELKNSSPEQKPSKIPMLDKNKLRTFQNDTRPTIDITPSEIIEEAMKVPTKTPSRIFRKSRSGYIKRGKSKDKFIATKKLSQINSKRSPSQIIEEAMKTTEQKSMSTSKQPFQIEVSVTADIASFVQKDDQVTITVKDQSTKKAISKTLVKEAINIDSADKATQNDRPIKVDKEAQENIKTHEKSVKSQSRSTSPMRPTICEKACLPEVVRVIHYDSEKSSIDSTSSEIPSSSVESEAVITEKDDESTKEIEKKFISEGVYSKIDGNELCKITQENIEKKIINQAMGVTSNKDLDSIQNISKNIAGKVTNLSSTCIQKRFKKAISTESTQKIDMKLPERNSIKLEPRTVVDIQSRLSQLENSLTITKQDKQTSKLSLKMSTSYKKPKFSEVTLVNAHTHGVSLIKKESLVKQLTKEPYIVNELVQTIDKAHNSSNCRKCGEDIENAIKDTITNSCPAPRRRSNTTSTDQRIQNFLQKRGDTTTKKIEERTLFVGPSPTVSLQQVPGRTLDDKLVILESNIKSGRTTFKVTKKEVSSDFRPSKEKEVTIQTSKRTCVNSSVANSTNAMDEKKIRPRSSKFMTRAIVNAETSTNTKHVKISPYLQDTLKRIYQDVNDIAAYKRRGSIVFRETVTNQTDHWKPIYKRNVQSTSPHIGLDSDTVKRETMPSKVCHSTYDTPKKIMQMVEAIQPTQTRPLCKQFHLAHSKIFPRNKILFQHTSISNHSVTGEPRTSRRSKRYDTMSRSFESAPKRITVNESDVSTSEQESVPRRSSHNSHKKSKGIASMPTKKTRPISTGKHEVSVAANISLKKSNTAVITKSIQTHIPNISLRSVSLKKVSGENWIQALNNKTVEILRQSAHAVDKIKTRLGRETNNICVHGIKQQVSKSFIMDTSINTTYIPSSDGNDDKYEEDDTEGIVRKFKTHQGLTTKNRSSNGKNNPTIQESTSMWKLICSTSEDEETMEEEIRITNLTDFPEKRRQCRPVPVCPRHPHSSITEYTKLKGCDEDIRSKPQAQVDRMHKRQHTYATTHKSKQPTHTTTPMVMPLELQKRLMEIKYEQMGHKYLILTKKRPPPINNSLVDYSESDE